MQLSIVIVNYNVKHFLEQCLHSVEKACKNIASEVFVVDNNSVDGSTGMVMHKFPDVELISNKVNLGFSKANNQAIRKAKGKYILLLNPDTVVEEDTFEKVIQFMEDHPEAGGLGVKMIDGRGTFLPESKRGLPTPWIAFHKIFGLSKLFPKSKRFGHYHLSYLDENETHEVEVLAGAFMLMRKETLDKVGLLDEAFFMYGEDIDLSYRITLGGYKNYYFPETRIIHYKGESTKKGSLNYVRIFYNAMIIFARKHFSKQYAGLFSLVINLAIYFRAAISATSNLLKRIWFPVLDFLAIYMGFLLLLPYWEKVRFEDGQYPEFVLLLVVPAYLLVWIISVFYSGGYDKPVSLLKLYRGMLWGTVFILVVYSLLSESVRFSRAITLIGTVMAIVLVSLVRFSLHFILKKEFSLGTSKPKKVAIVGLKKESKRVKELLRQTGINFNMVGYISSKRKPRSERYLGSIYQIREIVRVHQIEELIFCSEDVSSQLVIQTMMKLSDAKLEYKIAPPESISIIGSNSIDTAGDMYVVNVNSINSEKNLRNKRLFDLLASLILLLSYPFSVWFMKNKGGFFRNIIRVVFQNYSWIGYHQINSEAYLSLPNLKKGILKSTDELDNSSVSNDTINRINMLYARDYKMAKDFEITIKAFRKLGQTP